MNIDEIISHSYEYTISQADNGICVDNTVDPYEEPSKTVIYNKDLQKELGNIFWGNIRFFMEMKCCNEVKINMTISES